MTNFSGRIQDMTFLIDAKKIQDVKFTGSIPFSFQEGAFIEFIMPPVMRDIQAEIAKVQNELDRARINYERAEQQHKQLFESRKYTAAESAAMSSRRFEKEVTRLSAMIDGLKNNEASILADQIQSMRDYINMIEAEIIGRVRDQLQSIELRLSEINKPTKKPAAV